jgi:hypothetical protein
MNAYSVIVLMKPNYDITIRAFLGVQHPPQQVRDALIRDEGGAGPPLLMRENVGWPTIIYDYVVVTVTYNCFRRDSWPPTFLPQTRFLAIRGPDSPQPVTRTPFPASKRHDKLHPLLGPLVPQNGPI